QRSVGIVRTGAGAPHLGVCVSNTAAHDPCGLRIERRMRIDLTPEPPIGTRLYQIPAEWRFPIEAKWAPDYCFGKPGRRCRRAGPMRAADERQPVGLGRRGFLPDRCSGGTEPEATGLRLADGTIGCGAEGAVVQSAAQFRILAAIVGGRPLVVHMPEP